MKKLILIIAAFCCVTAASAQKYGYIYSKQIFDVIPQYKSAVDELTKLAKSGQEAIEKKNTELDALYDQYETYYDRMSQADAEAYVKLIETKEQELDKLQQSTFGEEGTYPKKQKELMTPIENSVMNAVKKIAEKEGYAMVFDLSTVKITIYESETVNLTNAVKKELGY